MKTFLTGFAVVAGCQLLSTGLAEPEKTGPGSLRLALDLIDGSLTWQQGVHAGVIQASGERADLSSVFQAAAGTIRMTE